MADVFLTATGFKELEEKLNFLKSVKRAEVSEKIKTAREFGDISENAEYDAAKDEQAMVEGEILEIEAKLHTAKIIEDVTDISIVTLGSKVKLKIMATNSITEYQIVGTTESDPFNNRISNESPVGRAILGHKKGEVISVVTPRGLSAMRIEEIRK